MTMCRGLLLGGKGGERRSDEGGKETPFSGRLARHVEWPSRSPDPGPRPTSVPVPCRLLPAAIWPITHVCGMDIPMRRLSHAVVLLFALVLTTVVCAQEAEPQAPHRRVEHVLIISIDGLRPDLALRANTPNLRSMLERGSFSLWARTIPESITLPSHTSMLTGVWMQDHGVNWNNDGRGPEDRHPPRVPSLFKLAKEAGLTTAIVTGKQKFVIFVDEGAIDWEAVSRKEKYLNDQQVADQGIEFLREHRPNVMFLHFAQVDGKGHGIGWGTPEQIEAIENADKAVGRVMAALDELGLANSTLVILSADHGGQGRRHGKDDARSRHIPWIAVGPGVRPGFDLTRFDQLQIDTIDTFATACYVLGIPLPEHCKGKPITQIFPDKDGK